MSFLGLAAITLTACGGSLLAAGGDLTCVVQSDGNANCFGMNLIGQAGHDLGTSPVAPGVVTMPKGIVVGDISVGMNDPTAEDGLVCAVTGKATEMSGRVRCWGDNAEGQLGSGAAGADSVVPVVVNLGEGVTVSKVATGAVSVCALGADGGAGVYCWGDNTRGQSGGTPSTVPAGPTLVLGTAEIPDPKGVTGAPSLLAMGAYHVCAASSATILCWGAGTSGQLGNGAGTDSSTPVRVRLPKQLKEISSIDAGGDTTCVIGSSKLSGSSKLWCWGAGADGQLGNGVTMQAQALVPSLVALPDGWAPASVSVGANHVCMLDTGSGVWCWGANTFGQLGNGTLVSSAKPVEVKGLLATTVATGRNHTCASMTAGRLVCWGGNENGQLGRPGAGTATTPAEVPTIKGLTAPSPRGVKVKLTGTGVVGGTLSVSTTPWRNANAYSYAWESLSAGGIWVPINGANRSRLKVAASLAGSAVRASVTGQNAWTNGGVVLAVTRYSPKMTISG